MTETGCKVVRSTSPGFGPGDRNAVVLTLEQAAGYLQVSKQHIANAVHGKFGNPPRFARIGRRIVFKQAWLDRWLEEIAG